MTERSIPGPNGEFAAPLLGSQAPVARFEGLLPFTPSIGLLDGGVNSGAPRWRESSPEEVVLDTLDRCKSRQNPTGTSAAKIARDLARATVDATV